MLDTKSRQQIAELIVEFAWRIDHEQGRGVEMLFTPEGVYVLFGHQIQGRSAIKTLYDHRRARGERTSRHLFGNLRIEPGPREDVATATSVLTLHAADGLPPHPLAPIMVADYVDAFERGPDRLWRFSSRETTLLFTRDHAAGG